MNCDKIKWNQLKMNFFAPCKILYYNLWFYWFNGRFDKEIEKSGFRCRQQWFARYACSAGPNKPWFPWAKANPLSNTSTKTTMRGISERNLESRSTNWLPSDAHIKYISEDSCLHLLPALSCYVSTRILALPSTCRFVNTSATGGKYGITSHIYMSFILRLFSFHTGTSNS